MACIYPVLLLCTTTALSIPVSVVALLQLFWRCSGAARAAQSAAMQSMLEPLYLFIGFVCHLYVGDGNFICRCGQQFSRNVAHKLVVVAVFVVAVVTLAVCVGRGGGNIQPQVLGMVKHNSKNCSCEIAAATFNRLLFIRAQGKQWIKGENLSNSYLNAFKGSIFIEDASLIIFGWFSPGR